MKTTKKALSILLAVLMCVSCFALTSSAVTVLSSINLTCPAPEADGAFPTAADVECATTLKVNSIYIYEVNGDTLVKASAPFEVGKTYEIDFTVATRTSSYNFDTNLSASVNDEACRAVYLSKTTANVVWTVTVGEGLHNVTRVLIRNRFYYRPLELGFGGECEFIAFAYYDGGEEQLISGTVSVYEVKSDGTKVETVLPFVDGKDYEISMAFSCNDSGSVIKFDQSAPPTVDFDDGTGSFPNNLHDLNYYFNDELLWIDNVNTKSIVVVWRFNAHLPVLTLLAEPAEGGTVIGNEYGEAELDNVIIKAIPNEGYYFAGWEVWTGETWEEYKADGYLVTVNTATIYDADRDLTFRAKFYAYEAPDLTGFTKLNMYPVDTLNPNGWYYDPYPVVADAFGSLFGGEANPNVDYSALHEEELKEAIDAWSAFYSDIGYGFGMPAEVYYNAETNDVAFKFVTGLIQKFSDELASGHMDEETNAFWRQCIKYAEPTTYTVTANAGEGGTVTGGGTYESGATATLTATPNSGYHFLGWYKGDSKVSGNAAYTFTVTKNVTLTAQFEKDAGPGDNSGNDNNPTQPQQQQSGSCKYCGENHTGFLGFFVKIFHSILALFGLRKK